MWKWDQGRLQYSKMENAYKIASTLCELNGSPLDGDDDHLKDKLIENTGLPFKPDNYTAWRNYARTLKALGLASKIDGKLRITEVCRRLASEDETKLTSDDYLTHISKVFSYPAPCFDGYTPSDKKTFPIAAIIKYILAKGQREIAPTVDVQEVSSILIGNSVTGLEDISFYKSIKATSYKSPDTEIRHTREMLKFISQFSFLFYTKGLLTCDMQALSTFNEIELSNLFRPIVIISNENKEIEIQQLFNLDINVGIDVKASIALEDTLFTEGKKVRTNHLRTERNKQAIKAYFDNTLDPLRCDICNNIVSKQYPWMETLIEVHHLLPLSSPLQNDKKGTSVNDLVGLCPNCHRATHSYYRKFLRDQGSEDFINEEQAKAVYKQIKAEFIQNN